MRTINPEVSPMLATLVADYVVLINTKVLPTYDFGVEVPMLSCGTALNLLLLFTPKNQSFVP